MVSFEHEQLNRLLASLFETLANEFGLDYVNAGSTTFERADLEQGLSRIRLSTCQVPSCVA